MGRHSIDRAPAAPEAGAAAREPFASVTDPVLLDAVQRELRRLRVEERTSPPAGRAGAVRRVETPFSGPVDVPLENVIGPHRPQRAPVPPVAAAPAAPRPAADRIPSPQPLLARPAAAPRSTSVGPAIVPTHRPAPVPVEAVQELEADDPQWRGPVGFSLRTALLSTGGGLLVTTALSLIPLIRR